MTTQKLDEKKTQLMYFRVMKTLNYKEINLLIKQLNSNKMMKK